MTIIEPEKKIRRKWPFMALQTKFAVFINGKYRATLAAYSTMDAIKRTREIFAASDDERVSVQPWEIYSRNN